MSDWGTETSARLHRGVEYSLRDVLTILFRHRLAMVAVLVSTVGPVGLWSFLAPPIYEVSAAILVKNSRGAIPLTPSASPQVVINQVREEDLNSEIEILRSRRLIDETLHALGVDESWRPQGVLASLGVAGVGSKNVSQRPYVDEMVLHLLETLRIEPVKRSNVVEIVYRSPDRERATQVVQSLLSQRTRCAASEARVGLRRVAT